MRITRSFAFHTKYLSKRIITISILAIATIAGLSSLSLVLRPTKQASAITPPDTCFNFNSATGTITNYYNNENNDSSQPACPKDVDIPSTIGGVAVTAIAGPDSYTGAFQNKQLTSVTIPNSVTSIGNSAFSQNQLTSVTIPSSVNTIGGYAFDHNKISSFTVEGNPTSVGSDILRGHPVTSISYNGVLYNDTVNTADQCFDINSTNGIIWEYKYADLQLIKSSGIACLARDVTIPSTISGTTIVQIGGEKCEMTMCAVSPAFRELGITSVVIPNSVTTIGEQAFQGNQLTIVTIPNSVTSIGNNAFSFNQLTSVTIPNSITSISEWAFSGNQLTSVTIPSSVTHIDPSAFALQSQWGRDIVGGENGAPNIRSSDPIEVQRAYDSIWYTRLYTVDPANPQGLIDGVYLEAQEGSDENNNGHQNDSLGGHLINPASLDLHYVNQTNSDLQASQTFAGQLPDNTYLYSYYASQGPVLTAPASPWSPTPAEQQAIQDALAVYYRLGDTVTITPPAIDGYITPPTKTFVLGAATNSDNYVYTQASGGSNEQGSDGQLAETGADYWVSLSTAGTLLFGGLVLVRLKNIR